MPKDNKSQNNNDKFYALFKEILETQSLTLKEVRDLRAEFGGQKPRPSDADPWGGI